MFELESEQESSLAAFLSTLTFLSVIISLPANASCANQAVFGEELDPAWKSVLDVLKLDREERAHAQRTVEFVVGALQQRTQGKTLFQLEGDFVDHEAQVLIRQQQHWQDQWANASVTNSKIGEAKKLIQELQAKLKRQTEGRVTLGALIEHQWLTAALLDYVIGIQNPGRDSDYTFAESEDFSLPRDVPKLRAWLAKDQPIDALTVAFKRSRENFEKRGLILIPMNTNIGQREHLALRFLPIDVVRLGTQDRPVGSESEKSTPNRGYLYDVSGLGQATPDARLVTAEWRHALHDAWFNWQLLLGANEGAITAMPKTEGVLRAILLGTAVHGLYDSDGETPNWADFAGVLKFVVHDFLFWPDLSENVINPNREADYGDADSSVYADFLPPGSAIADADLASALDLMLTRLSIHPEFRNAAEPLRELFAKFPNSVVSAKLLVLKMMNPPREHRSFSRPLTFL